MTLLFFLRSSNNSGNTGATGMPHRDYEAEFDWDAEAKKRRKKSIKRLTIERKRQEEEDLLLMLGEFDA